MITECFKDHWAFLEIEKEESLTRELMFDRIFIVKDEGEGEVEQDS